MALNYIRGYLDEGQKVSGNGDTYNKRNATTFRFFTKPLLAVSKRRCKRTHFSANSFIIPSFHLVYIVAHILRAPRLHNFSAGFNGMTQVVSLPSLGPS